MAEDKRMTAGKLGLASQNVSKTDNMTCAEGAAQYSQESNHKWILAKLGEMEGKINRMLDILDKSKKEDKK